MQPILNRPSLSIDFGAHFYQTHPDFINQFSGNKAFRYFYDNAAVAGVFHPKAFLFQKKNGEMAAIVGSANFTKAALHNNCEICILLTTQDGDSSALFNSLKQQIENLWNSATPFPEATLRAYRDRWKRRWATATKSIFGEKRKTHETFLEIKLLNLSWRQIYAQMQKT